MATVPHTGFCGVRRVTGRQSVAGFPQHPFRRDGAEYRYVEAVRPCLAEVHPHCWEVEGPPLEIPAISIAD